MYVRRETLSNWAVYFLVPINGIIFGGQFFCGVWCNAFLRCFSVREAESGDCLVIRARSILGDTNFMASGLSFDAAFRYCFRSVCGGGLVPCGWRWQSQGGNEVHLVFVLFGC